MKVTKVDILFFINLYLVNVEPLAYKEQVYITLFFFFISKGVSWVGFSGKFTLYKQRFESSTP